MLVYRVEGPNGNGPYTTNDFSLRFKLCDAHTDLRHPGPGADDELRRIEYDEYCGFNSVEALMEWFSPKWRKALEEEGFIVKVYEYADARVGSFGQTLFVKHDAVRVTSYKISELVAECKALA